MGDEKQKLTVEIDEKGAKETAEKVEALDDAVKGVADTTRKGAAAKKEVAAAQEKLTAAEGDYVALLSQIHPSLGAVVDGTIKAVKITGDLANQQISLTGIGKKLNAVIAANANAIKLLGAGGLAAGAILFAIHQYRKLKEEVEAATKALVEFHAEQTKGKQTQLTLEDDVNRAIDAREGEVGGDERKQAAKQAETLIRMRGADQGAVVSAAATTAGMGLGLDRLEQFAQATATGTAPTGAEATKEAVAEFFKSGQGQEAAQEVGVRRQISGERAGQAAEQLHGLGWKDGEGPRKHGGSPFGGDIYVHGDPAEASGPTAELQAAVRQLFGDVDVEKLSQLLQQMSAMERRGLPEVTSQDAIKRIAKDLFGKEGAMGDGGAVELTAQLRSLESYLQRQQDRSTGGETPIVVNINNHGTRNYGGGQGRPDNGEARLRRGGG